MRTETPGNTFQDLLQAGSPGICSHMGRRMDLYIALKVHKGTKLPNELLSHIGCMLTVS